MDILAARKKAAERSQTEKRTATAPEPMQASPPASPPPRELVEPDPAIPNALPMPEAVADVALDEPQAESYRSDDAACTLTSPATEQAPDAEMLSFMLGNEAYVIPVQQVNEVLKLWSLTPVPNAPDYIMGVSSLRGTMLAIVDLGKRLGLGAGERNEKSRVVVVTIDDEKIGFMVDRVTGVIKLSPDAVRAVPETVEQGVEYLRGIARKEDKLYILLDLDKAAGS